MNALILVTLSYLLIISNVINECNSKSTSIVSNRSVTARLRIKKAMEEHSVVPDVVDTVPKDVIEVIVIVNLKFR
jgi:hypothetical protein